MAVMFGFSLPKLLALAAILGIVWYGFKLIGRFDQRRRQQVKAAPRGPAAATGTAEPGSVGAAEEMVQCPVCQIYLAARSAERCDRPDCPY
jgi:uncharacterized protein